MKQAGYGKDYKYAHDFKEHFVEQEFMPDSLKGRRFYKPDRSNAAEAKMAERLEHLWGDKKR